MSGGKDTGVVGLAICLFAVAAASRFYLQPEFLQAFDKNLHERWSFRAWELFNTQSLTLALCAILIEANHVGPMLTPGSERFLSSLGKWVVWFDAFFLLASMAFGLWEARVWTSCFMFALLISMAGGRILGVYQELRAVKKSD